MLDQRVKIAGRVALDQADTFIRENPTHPRIDYAYYVKGLVEFERSANFIERWFNVDLDARPPQSARGAFNSFRRVVEEYPKSEYAHDARRRMIHLRNRLADYEIYVARYYLDRGAYIGAAQRAKQTIEQFDGAPAIRDALATLGDKHGLLIEPEAVKRFNPPRATKATGLLVVPQASIVAQAIPGSPARNSTALAVLCTAAQAGAAFNSAWLFHHRLLFYRDRHLQ